ncbi:MAG: hypothetical protein MI867_11475 [Pseudomonadales bacterium]|nr:hypothetical protein [Pseudomonadales bacterium]
MKNAQKLVKAALAAGVMLSPMIAQAHGEHIVPPWDARYSGTYDMECISADYAGAAVLWMNGKGAMAIPLGSMEGECDEYGVRPSQTWLNNHLITPFVNWCENIEARINEFGTLIGFTEECQRVAEEYAALFTQTIQDASPQPWREYTVDWISTHWHPWPSTHIFPNPFANDPNIDYVTTSGRSGRTGNVIIGWAIDGKANGITARKGEYSETFPLPNNYSMHCEIGAEGQLTHHEYDAAGGVEITNNDAAAVSCFTYNNDFLQTLDIDSAGFVIGADLVTKLRGQRR